jgi:hypothetical protein
MSEQLRLIDSEDQDIQRWTDQTPSTDGTINIAQNVFFTHMEKTFLTKKYAKVTYKDFGMTNVLGSPNAETISKLMIEGVGELNGMGSDTPELPTVAIKQAVDHVPVRNAGLGITWTAEEIKRSRETPINSLARKFDVSNAVFEEGIDRAFLIGHDKLGIKQGLLNHDEIPLFEAASTIKQLVTAGDFNGVYDLFFNQIERISDKTTQNLMVEEIVLPPAVSMILNKPVNPDYTDETYKTRIVKAFKADIPSFKFTTNWRLKGLGEGGKDRCMFICQGDRRNDFYSMNIVRPKAMLAPVTNNGFNYNQIMMARIAEGFLYNSEAFAYVDGV